MIMDVVYHPWPTPLAAAASQAGSVVVGGFELLLHQAARQVELMTGPAAAGAGDAPAVQAVMHWPSHGPAVGRLSGQRNIDLK